MMSGGETSACGVVLIAATVLAAPAEACVRRRAGESDLRRAGAERHPPGRASILLNEQYGRGLWDDMPEYDGGRHRRSARWRSAELGRSNRTSPSWRNRSTICGTETFSKDLHRVAANDGALRGRAAARLAAHPANANWLECAAQSRTATAARGLWRYPDAARDNSNSQFAVLALHEAERGGAPASIPRPGTAADYWNAGRTPMARGAINPQPRHRQHDVSRASAPWVICSEDARRPRGPGGERHRAVLPAAGADDALERGLRLDGPQLLRAAQPGGAGVGMRHLYYYLYGLERVGRLTATAVPRRARLVSRRDRASGRTSRTPSATTGRGRGSRDATRTSPRRWRCCFCRRAAGRFSSRKLKHGARRGLEQPPPRCGQPHRAMRNRQWDLDLTWQ